MTGEAMGLAMYEAGEAGVSVELGDPVVVMDAPRGDTRWGYFMFPSVWRLRGGRLVCAVTLGEDEMPSEGDYRYLWYLSDDQGAHWTHAVVDDDEAQELVRQRITLADGCQVYFEPTIARVDNLDVRPWPGNVGGWQGHFRGIRTLFRLGDLPEEYRSVRRFTRGPGEMSWRVDEASMDPDILVPAFVERVEPDQGAPSCLDSSIATRLRKLIRHVGDGRLSHVAGTAHYASRWATPEDFDGVRTRPDSVIRLAIPTPTGARLHNQTLEPVLELADGRLMVSVKQGRLPLARHVATGSAEQYPDLYDSADGGRMWWYFGSIPYARIETYSIGRAHVTPNMPAGNWMATMRTAGQTTQNSPLLLTRSYDHGHTWTEPTILRPSSTNPVGGLLPNGIVARLYGRPGLFITFCADGEGKTWGNDVTLVEADSGRETSCCNPGWIITGSDRFLVVYSDYFHHDRNGSTHKAILSQEVVVRPTQQL